MVSHASLTGFWFMFIKKLQQSILFSILLFVSSCSIYADTSQTTRAAEVMQKKLMDFKFSREEGIDNAQVASKSLLPDFYLSRGYSPAWHPVAVAKYMETVRRVDEHGLNPSDYHYDLLRDMLRMSALENMDSETRVDLDILLTDSLIRLGYHLIFGKINPKYLDKDWNIKRELIDGRDPIDLIQKIIDSTSIYESVEALSPEHLVYKNMKGYLAKYRKVLEQNGWPIVPQGPVLRLGDRSQRVAVLRQRLMIEYGIAESVNDAELFDSRLEEAVKFFQHHHFIEADGVVGTGTLAALNTSVQQRIEQIRVNLERARWVMHTLPERFVIVDIAGYEVVYYDDSQPLWRARAVVGKPYRATPVFRDKIRYLEFNPTWTIPPTILKKDILPKLEKDPGYLAKRNIRVLGQGMKEIDPMKIDWSRYASAKKFPYFLRQDPGPQNALGLVKFMFPNKHAVYLHDTPGRSLFDKTERTFSSGCIRVERPFELVELLLHDPAKWDQAAIKEIVDSRRTVRMNLPESVPVLLMYWTVRDNGDGVLGFKQDIYGRDRAVLEALNKPCKSTLALYPADMSTGGYLSRL